MANNLHYNPSCIWCSTFKCHASTQNIKLKNTQCNLKTIHAKNEHIPNETMNKVYMFGGRENLNYPCMKLTEHMLNLYHQLHKHFRPDATPIFGGSILCSVYASPPTLHQVRHKTSSKKNKILNAITSIFCCIL